MKLKKGDTVVVISGKDKGKQGVIQRSYPSKGKVVIDGVNMKKKNQKPTQANPEGSIVEIYAPIDVCKVALVDPKTKKATKVGYKVQDGKKVRFAKKSGTIIG